jgi:hypothetical protein
VDDERTEPTYLAILTGLLLAIGAALGWASHLAWAHRSNAALAASGWQVGWHGLKSVFPFALLAAALWVLPRRRTVLRALSIVAALATSTGLVAYVAAALRHDREGRDRVEQRVVISAHEAVPYWQFWTVTLGVLVAATVARWQHPDARRP